MVTQNLADVSTGGRSWSSQGPSRLFARPLSANLIYELMTCCAKSFAASRLTGKSSLQAILFSQWRANPALLPIRMDTIKTLAFVLILGATLTGCHKKPTAAPQGPLPVNVVVAVEKEVVEWDT